MDSGSDQNPQNGEKDAVKVEDKGKGGGEALRLGEDSDCSLQAHSWQPGIQNPYRGTVVWMVPENVDISVTLYRVSLPSTQRDWAGEYRVQPGGPLLGCHSKQERLVRPRIGLPVQREWPGGLLGGGHVDLPQAVGETAGIRRS